jgi:chromatin assembly factor 1 subunit A
MQDHDQILLKEIDSQLDLNFRPTSNLVKVILMAQIIHQLKQQVEYERKQKEAERKQKEAERKQKEAERKQKEAERKQKEAERKRAEQYKELLKKHNISFE